MYCNGYPCICSTCANNEERMHKTPGEAVEFCYTCDECSVYMGKNLGLKSRRVEKCDKYKVSDYEAQRRAEAAERELLKGRKYTIGDRVLTVIEGGKRK